MGAGETPPAVRSFLPPCAYPGARGSGRGEPPARPAASPYEERAVSTIGPSGVMATVCSTCAPREPSFERSVQPSASV